MTGASVTAGTVPARARELAARLAALFERDVEIVCRLNDAHRRLADANDRLWSGLAPERVQPDLRPGRARRTQPDHQAGRRRARPRPRLRDRGP